MKKKASVMRFTVAINLAVGNGILYWAMSGDSFATKVVIHTFASAVAILMLMALFHKTRRSAKVTTIMARSLFGALSVPLVSTFVLTACLGIKEPVRDAVVKAGYIAVIVTLTSSLFWVPFAIANALLLYLYLRHDGCDTSN